MECRNGGICSISIANKDISMNKNLNWRIANLKPEFEYREVPEYGTGMYSVNKETGEVCECKMEWNEDGSRLTCPVCGLDGT